MFTGIIENTGLVEDLSWAGTNITYSISSSLSGELSIDQSVSHDGVCLTVIAADAHRHQVTAIQETLSKTALRQWKPGTQVNLERCLPMNGRLDGHLVQGHVDSTGTCTEKREADGSWVYRISFAESFAPLIIEKGSICLNGISLTAFDVSENAFSVAIIPFTYEHTNMHVLEPGQAVNLEFDLLGKYINRYLHLQAGQIQNLAKPYSERPI